MARLIAPNGVEVNASEQDTPMLLAAGYKRADEQPKKPATRKRAAKPKEQ